MRRRDPLPGYQHDPNSGAFIIKRLPEKTVQKLKLEAHDTRLAELEALVKSLKKSVQELQKKLEEKK